jgi:hypothetical protein
MEEHPPADFVSEEENVVVSSNIFEDNDNAEPESTDDQSTKTLREIALEVLDGKWGVGQQRRAALEQAGFNHNEVHEETVKILNENK